MTNNQSENAVDLFTVEGAKAATADDAKTMLSSIKRRVSTIQRGDRDLRIAAAYAMHVHFRLAREAEQKVNVTDLGKTLGGTQGAVPRANIYLWKRLGSAVVDLGIEPNTDEWTVLNDVANRAPMAWALDGLDFETIKTDANGKPTIKTDSYVGVNRENFDKALAYLYPDGIRERAETDKDGEPATGKIVKARTTAEVEKAMVGEYGSEADQAEVENAAKAERMKRIKESVRYLRDNLVHLTPEEWAAIEADFGQATKVAIGKQQAAKKAADDKAAEESSAA